MPASRRTTPPGDTVDDQNDKLARKVSERYWTTDDSVNGIADKLGISKGRLYELIRPLSVDGSCPACGGGPPVHPNRTARDRGDVECPHCGWEGSLSDVSPEPPAVDRDRPAPSVTEIEDGAPPAPFTPSVVGGVLVGMAFGLLIGRWVRD